MTDDPYSLNRSAYDQIASTFAEKNAAMPDNLASMAEDLLARTGPGPARILDAGCGAGRDIAWMEARGGHLFGADLSRGMLAQARQVTRAPLVQMDMRFLGYRGGSFGAIWCCAALLHIPKAETPRVLAEMARILAPRGLLYVSVQKGSGEGIEHAQYQEGVDRFFTRYQPEEIGGLIEAAGFAILQRSEYEHARHWLWFVAQKNG